jgi:hypothetical protein
VGEEEEAGPSAPAVKGAAAMKPGKPAPQFTLKDQVSGSAYMRRWWGGGGGC